MRDFLWNAGLLLLIAGSGALFTQLYCRLAYFTCTECKSLNARRRSICRNCGAPLPKS